MLARLITLPVDAHDRIKSVTKLFRVSKYVHVPVSYVAIGSNTVSLATPTIRY